MNKDRNPTRYDAPTERQVYAPVHEGRVPPPSASGGPGWPQQYNEQIHRRQHPLNRVYRRRVRWVRMRWFSSGLVIGVIAGMLLTLGISAAVVTVIPTILPTVSGEPDVALVLGEGYLNREAATRINGAYDTGVPGLTLTTLNIDLKPDNQMDLQGTFKVEALFVNFNVNTSVKNQLSVLNGKLVINMVGDPQLGDLNVPLDLLPFDLKGEIHKAVDRVNNEVLVSAINRSIQSGFGEGVFTIKGVTTSDTGLTVQLKQQ